MSESLFLVPTSDEELSKMTSGILRLGEDLQVLIISKLEPVELEKKNDCIANHQQNVSQEEKRSQCQSDIRNLSNTCTFYRSLLAPWIFRKIMLRNDENIVASVEAAIARNVSIRGYVRELRLVGQPAEVTEEEFGLRQDGEVKEEEERSLQDEEEEQSLQDGEVEEGEEEEELDEEEEEEEVFKILPALHCFLSNLGSHFPNLATLSLELNFPLDLDEADENFYVFADDESPDEVLSKESNEIRREYLAKVYSAIAESYADNARSRIKKLELKDVMPKEVSTWRTSTWHTFLGQLESFEISMVGGDNGAGWCINVLDGYHAFIPKMFSFFFAHLLNTTSLTLRASKDFPLGLEGFGRHSPLPLAPDSLPNLRELTLEKCFVGPELIAFLSAHAQSLESVRLEDCMASINGLAENGIHWHTLFDSVAESASGKLTTFLVVQPEENSYMNWRIEEEETDDVREVSRLLAEVKQTGGTKRCFNYNSVDSKYGIIYDDDDEIWDTFMRGEDQRAWERLMDIVEANNKC